MGKNLNLFLGQVSLGFLCSNSLATKPLQLLGFGSVFAKVRVLVWFGLVDSVLSPPTIKSLGGS